MSSSGRDTSVDLPGDRARSEGGPSAEESEPVTAERQEGAGPTLGDAIVELARMAIAFVRQETADIVRGSIVLPVQRAGAAVALVLVAAFLVCLGLGFVAAGLLIAAAGAIGWVWAALVLGSAAVALGALVGARALRRDGR